MDASPLKLVDLITQQSTRLVVPVYQRPYSWDEENCAQLWDDVLSVARRGAASHFTGSVVWVQEGTMSAGGVTPCLVIDGQQRVTTVTLLIIALARYARSHPDAELMFSKGRIVNRGYLLDTDRKGDDRYRLTLSQGDRDTLRALVDNLECEDKQPPAGESRLLLNLAFFEGRLASDEIANLAWSGLQRLEVVSISLTQGQDNPQLIFESMNSTGKDLASADLIRNFVLMSYPASEQAELYSTYWHPIEETLGAESYDETFDRFARCWLTIVKAPETISRRETYQAFKRYVIDNGRTDADGMRELLRELRRFAGYFARVNAGAETDPELKAAFADVAKLDMSVADVLLVSLYDDYDAKAFGHDDFVSMVRVVESYLFRRMACDVASNGLNKFLPSIVARLNKVQAEGGNYAEALSAMLLGEAGTARRFPTDGEFESALRTRDAYGFKRCMLLLSRLENSYHPGAERSFSTGGYTIEHIMPQAALKSPEWREFLGEDPKAQFESHVHTLGNLTITAYNSELSDGSFAEKRARAVAGYDNEWVTISQELKETDAWTPARIEARGARLAARAVQIWPAPALSDEVVESYRPKKREPAAGGVSFSALFEAGAVPAGTLLYSASPSLPGVAVVREDGKIALVPEGVAAEGAADAAAGEAGHASPTAAFQALERRTTGACHARNGWEMWHVGGAGGELLYDTRQRFKSGNSSAGRLARRVALWNSFYDSCEDDAAFSETFDNVGERVRKTEWWVAFGIGYGFCHLTVRLGIRDSKLEALAEFPKGARWEELVAARKGVEATIAGAAGDAGVTTEWQEFPDAAVRCLILRRSVDLAGASEDELAPVWAWLRSALLALRAAVRDVYK